MMYLFNKKQEIIGMLTESDCIDAKLKVKINQAIELDLTVPASKAFGNDVRYIGVDHPLKSGTYVLLRLMSIKDSTDRTEYSAYELAYQELSSYGYIQDRRFKSETGPNLMKVALSPTPWTLGLSNINVSARINFYYVSPLDAVSSVIKMIGGEVYFYITLDGSKVTGRYMDYVVAQGNDTSKVFVHGSNLLSVVKTGDNSNIYTAILPRGKGEQVSEGEDGGADGYGRRILIDDVSWSKAKGDPLDKPKGDVVLVDPVATAEYGHIDGRERLLIQTFDDIDDRETLLKTAYNYLQSVNHPAIHYEANVADTDGLNLGDTVLIMHDKRDLSYKTRVFEVNFDLLQPANTTIELGTDLSQNSITKTMSTIAGSIANVSDNVVANMNLTHPGSSSTSYSATQPEHPKQGDVWFKSLPNGKTELYYYNGTAWILSASTDSQWQQNSAELNGDHTVFRGTSRPIGAVKGDVWYMPDPDAESGISMFSYSGSTWVKFNGQTDASKLQSGVIDARRISVINLDANSINTGYLSANFIKGGQIDASQINVINLNVNSLIGNLTQFIKSNWDGKYGSTSIDYSGMTVSSGEMMASFNASGIQIKKGKANMYINSGAVYINTGDKYAIFGTDSIKLLSSSFVTEFKDRGMFFSAGENIGSIEYNGMTGMPDNYRGLIFNLQDTGDYMAWAAVNSDPHSSDKTPYLKLAWYRSENKPNGVNSGFVFSDQVTFNGPIKIESYDGDVAKFLKLIAQVRTFILPATMKSNGTIGTYYTINI